MRLFAFYAWHSFVNQIKKLCRTWVAVFLLVCVGFGVVIGLGAAFIAGLAESGEDATPADSSAIVLPEGGTASDTAEPEEEAFEFWLRDPATGANLRQIEALDLMVLIVMLVVLTVLCLMVITADKSNIFLPADTVLLFTAPLSPQKVLLFRLSGQIGVFAIASLYMFGQLPNLMRIPGFTWGAFAGILFVYAMMLAQSMILKSMAFIYCAGDAKKQRTVRWGVYGLLLALAGGVFVYSGVAGTGVLWQDALLFFLADWFRYIPVLGWLPAVPAFAFEGKHGMAILFVFLNIALVALLLWLISRMKADFYEPALAKSEEYAERMQKMQESRNGGMAAKTRTKDRSERFVRNELRRGSGASIYFWKEMYNRKRFALFGLFTKTFGTYLVLAVGLALILFFAGVPMLLPSAALIALIAFYRTLGNPLEADTKLHYFSLLPAKSSEKLFWSILAGLCGTAMDAALPLIACAVIARASVWETLCSFLLVLSLDFYATCTSVFINLSLPNNAGQNIKQVVQIMFLYFGVLPAAAAVAVGAVLGYLVPGLLGASLLSLGLGFLFFSFLPKFI